MIITRPNLFVIGAMKSGTSSLYKYLQNHPEIFMSKPKEPMHFSRESNWSQGDDCYLELFEAAGDASIIGESSTEYTKLPRITGVPQRIAQFNPEARFIYIMRDPVERTISQYWHMWRAYGERRDILTAIREDTDYLNISHYAMQLEPYFEIFGQNKVKILTLEEMKADVLGTIRNLYLWLGVDASFSPNLKKKANVTPKQLRGGRKGFGPIYSFHYSRFWRSTIRPLIPQSIRSYGKKIAEERVDRTSISMEHVIDFLRPIQIKQTKELSRMLDRQFPEWTVLFGTSSFVGQ